MVLADWTFTASGLVIASPNNAPAGGSNPTLQMTATASAEKFGSAGTINSVDCTGIRNGKITGYARLEDAGGATNIISFVHFRRLSDTDMYSVYFRPNGTRVQWAWRKLIAGVSTDIISLGNLVTNVNSGTWFYFELTWWSAAGKAWIRLKTSLIGGALNTETNASSDTVDLQTGSTTTIGVGAQSALGTQDIYFDDWSIYG